MNNKQEENKSNLLSSQSQRSCEWRVFADNSGIFFYFAIKNIYCEYSVEALNEALLMSIHNMFIWRTGEKVSQNHHQIPLRKFTVLSSGGLHCLPLSQNF